MIARTGTSFSLAVLVTFGLFFFMQQMTSMPDIRLAEAPGPLPDIMIGVEPPDPITYKTPEPVRPKPEPINVDPLPPLVKSTPDSISLTPGPVSDPLPPTLPGTGTTAFVDGEVYAITAIAPDYPVAAARKGLSGYVVVGFTVDRTGAVTDAYVIESSSSLFDRSALRAIRKFKYKPKVVDGTPVAQGNLMYKFTYELQDDA